MNCLAHTSASSGSSECAKSSPRPDHCNKPGTSRPAGVRPPGLPKTRCWLDRRLSWTPSCAGLLSRSRALFQICRNPITYQRLLQTFWQ